MKSRHFLGWCVSFSESVSVTERDNLQEDLHCQALRVYAALGDRSGLVNQYQEMKRVLEKELNIELLQSTAKLYQSLLERSRK